jgi:pimeloyl-[acyl-carrier protein] methyl ester esterase
MRPTLILLHGWGFDAQLWDALADLLADYPIVRWDRGYFGAANQRAVEGLIVGIGHSLGSMLLADALPENATLVAINGFDHFTGSDGVPRRVVERMQARFAETPAETLAEFRARCGAAPGQADLRTERLGQDLSLLATHRAKPMPRAILSLQGGQDPILPPSLRETVFPGAARATCEEAGHLLPVTHAAWCAAQIDAFLCR